MSKEDGEPAFPFEYDLGEGLGRAPHTGMSLRDYFAGQAVAGVFQSFTGTGWHNPNEYQIEAIVRAAWKTADAMLAERSKS